MELIVDFADLLIEFLNAVAEIPDGLFALFYILAGLFQTTNLFGCDVALVLQVLHLAEQGATLLVERKNLIQIHIGATSSQRLADVLFPFSDDLDIEHVNSCYLLVISLSALCTCIIVGGHIPRPIWSS